MYEANDSTGLAASSCLNATSSLSVQGCVFNKSDGVGSRYTAAVVCEGTAGQHHDGFGQEKH